MEAEVSQLAWRIFLHVSNKNKKQMDSFPPAEIFAKNKSEFFTVFPSMSLQFHTDAEGNVMGYTYDQDDKPNKAQRLLQRSQHTKQRNY